LEIKLEVYKCNGIPLLHTYIYFNTYDPNVYTLYLGVKLNFKFNKSSDTTIEEELPEHDIVNHEAGQQSASYQNGLALGLEGYQQSTPLDGMSPASSVPPSSSVTVPRCKYLLVTICF
jgi:hypothetical protein